MSVLISWLGTRGREVQRSNHMPSGTLESKQWGATPRALEAAVPSFLDPGRVIGVLLFNCHKVFGKKVLLFPIGETDAAEGNL